MLLVCSYDPQLVYRRERARDHVALLFVCMALDPQPLLSAIVHDREHAAREHRLTAAVVESRSLLHRLHDRVCAGLNKPRLVGLIEQRNTLPVLVDQLAFQIGDALNEPVVDTLPLA